MKRQLCFVLYVLLLSAAAAGLDNEAVDPAVLLERLYTVNISASVYSHGDGGRLWTEDLQQLESVWGIVSPREKAAFRDFLLPIYMREALGLPLFEEDEGIWLETAERILFDSSL